MSNRLIFRSCRLSVINWGGTRWDSLSVIETIRLIHESRLIGKSVKLRVSGDGDCSDASRDESQVISSAGKSVAMSSNGTRTVNRHRWTGREYQG